MRKRRINYERLTGKILRELLPGVRICPEATIDKRVFLHDVCIRGSMRVDYWIPSLLTIVEYNGSQHYRPWKPTPRWTRAFEEQQCRDEFLRTFCKERGYKLIEIRGTNVKEQLIKGLGL